MLPHEDNVRNKFRIRKERHIQMRENRTMQSPGRMTNSSYYIAPAGDRTHNLGRRSVNMIKVSYALTTRPRRRSNWYSYAHFSLSDVFFAILYFLNVKHIIRTDYMFTDSYAVNNSKAVRTEVKPVWLGLAHPSSQPWRLGVGKTQVYTRFNFPVFSSFRR